ncbi:hypothetical protein, partial [Streptomyces sp. NPDC055085]
PSGGVRHGRPPARRSDDGGVRDGRRVTRPERTARKARPGNARPGLAPRHENSYASTSAM